MLSNLFHQVPELTSFANLDLQVNVSPWQQVLWSMTELGRCQGCQGHAPHQAVPRQQTESTSRANTWPTVGCRECGFQSVQQGGLH
jgi:hypothetical protein